MSFSSFRCARRRFSESDTLEVLRLANSEGVDLKSIEGLSNLRELWLPRNADLSVLDFSAFPKLEVLRIDRCQNASVPNLPSVRELIIVGECDLPASSRLARNEPGAALPVYRSESRASTGSHDFNFGGIRERRVSWSSTERPR